MNKLISTVAAAAVLTTTAFAFETNTKGDVTNFSGDLATFTKTKTSKSAIRLGTLKGDALIYPAFNEKDGFGSEFTLRNNKNYGIVAKVSIYDNKDSKEILDINVYLSANDVFRFRIADGKFYTQDDSAAFREDLHDNTKVTFASPTNPIEKEIDVESGYVIAYGMGESNITTHGPAAKSELFKVYREVLDSKRKFWNEMDTNMDEGVYVGKPAVLVAPYVNETNGLKDVDDSALSGQVRIYNAEGVARDLLANAKAIKNFTEKGKIMLWSPGELSNLHDRDMNQTKGSLVKYDSAKILNDAKKFIVKNAFYTFNNNGETPDVDNQLVITQIYKRTLVQLGNVGGYWTKRTCSEDNTVDGYSFQAVGKIWNEKEEVYVSGNPGDIIVSPGNSGPQYGYCYEVAELNRPEKDTDMEADNGYVNFYFGKKGVPAIVTQMSASKVGDDYRINWIPAATTR
jgi:hypothetical protein